VVEALAVFEALAELGFLEVAAAGLEVVEFACLTSVITVPPLGQTRSPLAAPDGATLG